MGRLIDADALVYSRVRIAHEDGTIGGYNAVVMSSEIKHAPTIEAEPQELIRCADCKYYSTETEQTSMPNMRRCTWWRTIGTLPIDFCSRAERRGEE